VLSASFWRPGRCGPKRLEPFFGCPASAQRKTRRGFPAGLDTLFKRTLFYLNRVSHVYKPQVVYFGLEEIFVAPLSSLRVRALMHVANFNEEGRPRGGLIEGRDSADCFIRSASPIRGFICECLYVPRQEAADATGGFIISCTRRSSQARMSTCGSLR
jgi:hypothetical protein